MRKSSQTLHIGLDDTDSSDGMCTTYLTYNLVQNLIQERNCRLVDYPNLIRLNPNIPWKTRGNAALVIRLEARVKVSPIFDTCKSFVKRYATSKRANAGLVILEGESIPEQISDFSRSALHSVQSLSLAKNIIARQGLHSFALRNGQGLVGALAGIGNELKGDHTFELIAYRKNCRVQRRVPREKVIAMDEKTKPSTFNCYDRANNRVLITPHGPDPVLLGIRGESPSTVRRAFSMLLPLNNLLGWMIFRSNQGTGEHLQFELDLSHLKSYTCGHVAGSVVSKPIIMRGGHVFFCLANESGSIDCAAYEPTGDFRKSILALVEGDLVEVGGGIRPPSSTHSKVLNVEYMIPKRLAEVRCLRSDDWDSVERDLEVGAIYLPDLKAHRHLTLPLQRYGMSNGRAFSRPNAKELSLAAGRQN